MTFLIFLAFAPIMIFLTLIVVAVALEHDVLQLISFLLLLVTLLGIVCFNEGAKWQHDHTLENYILSPIQKP